jgi:hypothetical protein
MPLNALAPDQRAVVQLVLTRDRSYAQIAELLKISEDAVRARAHKGLAALAPDVELPADKLAQLADFLLGQQNGKPTEETEALLTGSDGAREWAETVRAQLAGVSGASLPELPEPQQDEDAAAVAAGPGDAPAPRPRPLRDTPRTPAASGPAAPGPTAVAGASSRLGGALLIGLAIVAIVVLVLVLFVFSGDDKDPATAAKATATPSATATPAPVGEIPLKGAAGSKGTGVMRLYTAQQQLAFTLEGTGVPANNANEAYAVWFTSPGKAARRLGFAQPVGSNGRLGTTGPRTEDLDRFPRWLATFKRVVVTRETNAKAKKPGPVVLVGTLPSASG